MLRFDNNMIFKWIRICNHAQDYPELQRTAKNIYRHVEMEKIAPKYSQRLNIAIVNVAKNEMLSRSNEICYNLVNSAWSEIEFGWKTNHCVISSLLNSEIDQSRKYSALERIFCSGSAKFICWFKKILDRFYKKIIPCRVHNSIHRVSFQCDSLEHNLSDT